jgi:lipopolysaccharide transport system ATP-binding protein
MAVAIVVEGLSKQFRRYHPDRPGTLRDLFLRGFGRLRPTERFWALRDVSFTVPPGRAVGVIGANGAGKSTLLRLIAGVGRPSEGRATVRGLIGALLDLGAGFHQELTGRENVFVNGIVRGLTRQEVKARFESIVAFAELQAFIDAPLRTYSGGMWMRLAFAVAVHVEPDVLLVDEVLSVGEMSFRRKCLDRIAGFRAQGRTILLASHEMPVLREICDDALWLQAGRVARYGPVNEVADQYEGDAEAEPRGRLPVGPPPTVKVLKTVAVSGTSGSHRARRRGSNGSPKRLR